MTRELAPYLPGPRIVEHDDQYAFEGAPQADGDLAIHSWLGNVGVCLRALSYILRNGGDGLRRVSDMAVLNANYLLARLRCLMPVDHPDGCLHEFVASGKSWKDLHGVRTLDIAKRLLDFGVHAPTIYFPLIVEEAFMVEPTECETRESLDQFVEAIDQIRKEAETDPQLLKTAPHSTPVGRLDETQAARQPDLRWLGPCIC